jgi:hypothetical protein
VAFTTQVSMIPAVIGSGQVASARAPYACGRCGREEERLLHVASICAEGALRPPTFPCPCGGGLELDDLPERYFAFLRG